MQKRPRIGVVGRGAIAQVMHLDYLSQLPELFDIFALCDVSPGLLQRCAEDYEVRFESEDWRGPLGLSLDALLICTSDSRAPIAIAAAKAGLHVLAENPMCFSVNEGQEMLAAALGEVDVLSACAHHLVLLDSLAHEFNAVRGVLGEPDELAFTDISETGVTIVQSFRHTRCVLNWADLPDISRYAMEFALFAPESRLALEFLSPFPRNVPTMLIHEGGRIGSAQSRRSEEINSYEESLRQPLSHFHECVTTGKMPVTSATDALRDIALCRSIIDVHRRRVPRSRPADTAAN